MTYPPRLLPWTGSEGKPCFLVTDDCDSPVSRLADATESVQLGMGGQLLVHAREILPDIPNGELRLLTECLNRALDDALRVAESSGRRLEQMN
ncbi:hypothetical protein ACWCQN_28140 [Streptomyces sp. NPDC001984]|uniref:hypothetical protein n=1 Tax=Streptomyces sp. NPDC002619 TaxID=3364655 RepID=UPI0036C01700